MVIRNPYVIATSVIAIIIAIFVFKKKQITYKKGTKIANAKVIKENELFKKKIKQYKIISSILKGMCLFSIIVSSVLLARISYIKEVNEEEYSRDIMLCMDVSGSVNELNESVVKSLKSIVESLQHERFGISIFNTSSVLVVPLTNDYNYVLDTLDKLKSGFKAENSIFYGDYEDLEYIRSGTLIGNEKRGSSLIGDGLAACIYDFPELKEDTKRTRLIIFTTDNELAGEPYVTIDEAGTIAKNNNIKVYGIATKNTTSTDGEEFKKSVEKTGGVYYKQTSSSTKNIIDSIEKESKSLIKEHNKVYQIDDPLTPFLILLISIVALIILDSKVIS